MSSKLEVFLWGKKMQKVRNQCLDGAQHPPFCHLLYNHVFCKAVVDSLECVTPNHYILQSLTAILCHFLSLHNPCLTKNC